MNKVIIVKQPDGGVHIITPAPEMFDATSRSRIELGIDFADDNAVLQWIVEKDVPAGLEWRITELSNIPEDRTFRNAWTDANKTETVDIDISKAKELHKNNLRELRKPLLEKLDADFMRALEADDNTSKTLIAAKKQQLRDITKMEFSNDPDVLKTQIPAILYS